MRKSNLFTIIILMITMFVSANAENVQDKLDKVVYRSELDFKDVPLTDVLANISKASGLTIVADSTVKDKTINLYFSRGQKLSHVIEVIKNTTGLNSRVVGDVLVLGGGDAGDMLPTHGKIIGRVIGRMTKKGLEGVEVVLLKDGKETVVKTEVGGNFIIDNVKTGTYIIKGLYEGYKPAGSIIELTGKMPTISHEIVLVETDTMREQLIKDGFVVPDKSDTMEVTKLGQNAGKITEKILLKYELPSKVKPVLDAVVEGVEVISVESKNILVLKGTGEAVETAKQLILELDKPVKQVRITAQVLDISGGLTEKLGVDWSYERNNDTSAAAPTNTGDYINAKMAGGTPTLKFIDYFTDGGKLDIALNILQKTNDAQIASVPSIVTVNGEAAEINITEEQYVGYTEKTDDDGNKVKEPEFKEAGTLLSVTPIIRDNPDGKDEIILEVKTEVSSFKLETATSTGKTDSELAALGAAQKNVTTTKVRVLDGGTIFIGGLKRKDVKNNVTKVPLLGDIPFLGRLFKTEETIAVDRDIFIQIKAEVVTAENMNNEISDETFATSKINFKERIFKGKRK